MKDELVLTVHPDTMFGMFRELNPIEEKEFRSDARLNFDPANDKVLPIWHPVYQDECFLIIKEYLKR